MANTVTYPFEPLRLFAQKLPDSRGLLLVRSWEDLRRECLIRYPFLRPHQVCDTVTGTEIPHIEQFNSLWPQYPNFGYECNSIGFRDHEPLDAVDACYFGCSQTYAMGNPVQARWTSQLDQIKGWTSNNFGLCGTGHEEVVQLFMAVSNVCRFHTAVINLPDIHRHVMLFDADGNVGDPKYYNLMITQHWKTDQKNYGRYNQNISEAWDARYRLPQYTDFDYLRTAVQTITYVAAMRGIRVVFTSWTQHVYEALMVYAQYPGANFTLAPWADPNTDIGRDGVHFGIHTHRDIALKIASVI